MAKIALSNESKSEVDLSLEAKPSSLIWDDAEMTWEEQDGTWAQPEYVLSKESKSKVALTLGETK